MRASSGLLVYNGPRFPYVAARRRGFVACRVRVPTCPWVADSSAVAGPDALTAAATTALRAAGASFAPGSASGWGPPDDNGHALLLLGRQGVLTADLAGRMPSAVGFRNVLVHEYVTVDDRIVLERLDDPSDLRAFAEQVAAWLPGGDGTR